jgi:hypothetical protein
LRLSILVALEDEPADELQQITARAPIVKNINKTVLSCSTKRAMISPSAQGMRVRILSRICAAALDSDRSMGRS